MKLRYFMQSYVCKHHDICDINIWKKLLTLALMPLITKYIHILQVFEDVIHV